MKRLGLGPGLNFRGPWRKRCSLVNACCVFVIVVLYRMLLYVLTQTKAAAMGEMNVVHDRRQKGKKRWDDAT